MLAYDTVIETFEYTLDTLVEFRYFGSGFMIIDRLIATFNGVLPKNIITISKKYFAIFRILNG